MIEDEDIRNYLATIGKLKNDAPFVNESPEGHRNTCNAVIDPHCSDADKTQDYNARLMVFGDSHSSFFAGEDKIVENFKESTLFNMNFHVYHMGPVLAASLVERQSTLMAREKILDTLRSEKPTGWEGVVFAFGEIDCRFHVIKRLGHQNATFTSDVLRSINVTVLRYVSFLHEVVLLGYKPIVWGPVASNCLVVTNPGWPNYGTTKERNIITREFSKLLGSYCATSGIDFISILSGLITETIETNKEYYFDGGHLGQNAWQIALPMFQARLGHILNSSLSKSHDNTH